MADEEKKYLVNVESNLDEYAKEAAKAREEVERLTLENIKLKGSSTASKDEIEKSNAALKAAQAEYRTAQSQVVNFQKGLNSEKNSRKELNEVLKLQQYALGKLGDGYIKDAQGILRVNPLYAEQTKKIRATKEAIILLDKAQLDGRSSVGLYSEAIQGALGGLDMMPGVMGRASSGVKMLGTSFKALVANPVGIIIAAVVGVVALLAKAFKNSQPLMDAFNKVSAAIGATFKVLLDRVSNFTEFLASVFNKELRESRKEAKALNDELLGIDDTMSRQEKRKIRRSNRKGIIDEIREESIAMYGLVESEQALEDSEIAFIQRKSDMKRQVEELFASTKDENLSDRQRIENLDKAIALTKEMTQIEVEFAKERARISDARTKQGNSTREELRANEELQAAANEAEAQGAKELKRLGSERFSLIKRIGTEAATAAKAAQDLLDKELAAYEKHMESKRKLREKEGVDEFKRLEQNYNTAREWEERDIEAGFEYHHLKNQNNIDALNTLVDAEYAALLTSVEYTKMTNNEKLLAEEQYNQAKKNLSDIRIANQIRELDTIADLSGSLSQLFGEQTIAAKGLSVAQALISTYTAGVKAMAELPLGSGPFLRFATLAAIIAAGLVQVKNILAVKVPGKGSGGSVPSGATAITSSMPAQRAFAPSAASTIFTQPKLSQEQVNALPNPAPQLTAEDIARAVSKLPAPKVTVEDINARVKESKSVEVMGVI